jgi:outer membrane protein assembly factor BamB
VFVTTTTENGAKCRVLCLDRAAGRVIWNVQVFEQVPRRKESKNSYATPTPATDGERVYAVFGDGSVAALTFDGRVAWTNREVQFYSRHGLGASPLLHGGLLIMPFDGSNPVNKPGQWPNNTPEERLGWQTPWDKSFVAAFDTKTGRRAWTGTRGWSRIAHATPIVIQVGGQDQILSIAGDVIQGFDPATGERLWTARNPGEGLVPSPAFGGGLVFAASGFDRLTIRAVRVGGRGDVSDTHIAWEQRKGCPSQPSLLYVAPHLYALGDGGVLTCYEADTGEVVWQERIGGNFSASPVYADGKMYLLSEAGETTVVEVAPQFRIRSKNPLNEKCQASMAVSQGRIFIRTDKNLFCIGAP